MSNLLDNLAAAYQRTAGRDQRDVRAAIVKVVRDEDRFKEKDPTRGAARGATRLAEEAMTPPDLKTTRTYYWSWQACGLAAAMALGGAMCAGLWLADDLNYITGIVTGVVMANAWHRTKYEAPRRRPDAWHPDRR